jgi:hypothetical protein
MSWEHRSQRADALRRSAAAALVAVALAACAAPLTRDQIAALDYGPRPENYAQIVRAFLQPGLVEPEFARIEFKNEPRPLYQEQAFLYERGYGWAVCALVTDKDRRGAYPDPYPMVFYLRGDKVAAVNGDGLERAAGVDYAAQQCKALGYDPS